jgi:hypothetical protein
MAGQSAAPRVALTRPHLNHRKDGGIVAKRRGFASYLESIGGRKDDAVFTGEQSFAIEVPHCTLKPGPGHVYIDVVDQLSNQSGNGQPPADRVEHDHTPEYICLDVMI